MLKEEVMNKVCHLCKRFEYNKSLEAGKSTCPQFVSCTQNPKLNLGSGLMLIADYINFDLIPLQHGGQLTDIIGNIMDAGVMLPTDYFQEILSSHVIEHFYEDKAVEVLQIIFSLLRKGGKLIIEAPDILGCYQRYIVEKKDIKEYCNSIYGNTPHRKLYGEQWMHRSGWTGQLMADTLKGLGFEIKHIGIGLTHGMGARDFRVEAIKP
jgi:hypothetical protein